MLSEAVSLDLDVHIHALGERAISAALDAIAASREKLPDTVEVDPYSTHQTEVVMTIFGGRVIYRRE